MQTYILLLRGINVGGHRKIKMAEFKTELEKFELQEVKTYIQSGNIVFKYEKIAENTLAAAIEGLILKKYGFEVSALLLTAESFVAIFNNNPYLPERENEIEKLYCTLLYEMPEPAKMRTLKAAETHGDEFAPRGKCLYFYYVNGYGKSKLNNPVIESKLKVKATTRNWKTMTKLMEMIG